MPSRLIPQSNDPSSTIGADERGSNDTLTQGFDGQLYLFGDAVTMTDGTGGNDKLYGLNVYGDAAFMSGSARGGNDALYGGGGNDGLFGDAYGMSDSSRGGNDALYGGEGNDNIFGDAETIVGTVRGGNDALDGGDGSDFISGDASFMYDASRGGNDALYGGGGNDSLYGDAQAARPGAGLVVTGGDDRIDGGTGDDAMWGDFQFVGGTVVHGNDIFAFGLDSGQDTVQDFVRGSDKLDVAALGYSGLGTGAGLLAVTTAGADSVVHFADANQVVVNNVVGLTPGDFIFA